jgi:hypothetical protein
MIPKQSFINELDDFLPGIDRLDITATLDGISIAVNPDSPSSVFYVDIPINDFIDMSTRDIARLILNRLSRRVPQIRVWFCTDHDGLEPVPRASIVVAENITQAYALLDKALVEKGLKPSSQEPYTLEGLDVSTPKVIILSDGDY